jgi:ATP-dependent helicase/DNAse subunit B
LLGIAEGMFPQVERPDPFLDEVLRQKLGLEPRLNREQAGLFYQAVARADQYLLITRSYLTESGEDWEASPFWKDVQKRFDRTALKVARPDDMSSLSEAASTQELLFWAVRHKNLPTQFLGLAQRWEAIRYGREILRSRRAKRAAGTHEGFSPSLMTMLAERYAPGKVWSASRLEAYGNCPQQFYVRVALSLEPRTPPELGWSVMQMGSMLHKILEETYRYATNPEDVTSVLITLSEVADRVFEGAPLEYGFRPSTLWQFEKSQFLSILQQTIQALDVESRGWTPIAYEQKFGIADMPPLEINLGTETVLVRGVIDRLDRNSEGEIRVVDYKTGSSHLEPKDLKSGARLQLPLYAMAAEQTLQLGNVTEGIYGMIQAAKPGALKLSRCETDQGQGAREAIQVVVEQLKKILAGIRAAEFPPNPPKSGCSPYCPAVQWCWRYEPGWGGRK